jgi:hypothetical protein
VVKRMLCSLIASLSVIACRPDQTTRSATPGVPIADFARIARALADGSLRFELKSLSNESKSETYAATSFTHRGTVVALGDSLLTRLPYLVYFSVKRLSGGDPNLARRSDDMTLVFVHEGVGTFSVYGGYRLEKEKWEPERIEVAPVGAIPGILLAGPPVKE